MKSFAMPLMNVQMSTQIWNGRNIGQTSFGYHAGGSEFQSRGHIGYIFIVVDQ